ncbi:ABC transporter substrate-binding protein [Amphritea opalescens]|uniref:ABC transporter substrate-binding protein n=1 Tax=Amphritea opalescens TaxID=2490544 RepID=A0A430KPC3_9GAMM|nr:ABC transporter substrate-binding protein [Amphritea opalescens]RTE65341.1 ABC transporter substrate-binding protein [Amphritea opalescens]
MTLKSLQRLIAACTLTLTGSAFAATELVVQYPYGGTFKETFTEIKAEFESQYPDIQLNFRAPYENYEDATQKVMRESITKRLPDISFQGLNRVRPLVERDIAVSLEPFIAKEQSFDKEGYHKAMLDIGTYNHEVYAVPFAVSLPIAYYNMDLVRQAGWDEHNLPKTWDEVIQLAQQIDALGDDVTGMVYGWQITGNWLWQAPVFSQGGSMLSADEKTVSFGGEEGQWALETFARFFKEGGMKNYSSADGRQSFISGKAGIWFWSTSNVTKAEQLIGDKFEMKTNFFPSVKAGGRLPAGGNAIVMLTKDAAKQDAAWKFIKFSTSGKGAAIVAQTTGYMPPNKKANEEYLTDFYRDHPNHYTAVKQLPLMTDWYAFPGKNGLKITKIIHDHMQSIASGDRVNESGAVLNDMVSDVQKYLPR